MPVTTTIRARQKTWIVLATDGRYVALGRHSDPTDLEVSQVEDGLVAQGLAGWLAVMEGDYWTKRTTPTLRPVRPLASPQIGFDAARTQFEAQRRAGLGRVR